MNSSNAEEKNHAPQVYIFTLSQGSVLADHTHTKTHTDTHTQTHTHTHLQHINQHCGVNIVPKDRLLITQYKQNTLFVFECVSVYILAFAKVRVLPKIQFSLKSINSLRYYKGEVCQPPSAKSKALMHCTVISAGEIGTSQVLYFFTEKINGL